MSNWNLKYGSHRQDGRLLRMGNVNKTKKSNMASPVQIPAMCRKPPGNNLFRNVNKQSKFKLS